MVALLGRRRGGVTQHPVDRALGFGLRAPPSKSPTEQGRIF